MVSPVYLLDTCVVSELRRPRPQPAVVAWLVATPDAARHLCAVTLGEIQAGVEKTRDQDPAKAAEIEGWLDRVAAVYNVLPLDGPTCRRWAKLMHHQSDTVLEDALIAACALAHGLTVVTRHTRHFERFGVPLLDPFTSAVHSVRPGSE
jgi:predicted nucleic acid-binding protein